MDKKSNNQILLNLKGLHGAFVISLDFELLWGLLDLDNIKEYEKAVEGGRKAIPQVLKLFQQYGIHATWGIVGLMTHNSIEDCLSHQPKEIPQYTQSKLSAYTQLSHLSDCNPALLFGADLIGQIASSPNQEIGSHTYSHYYCLENGQDRETFKYELQRAREVTIRYNNQLKSIILPRNQYNPCYADILKENGFRNYRGTERTWFYTTCERKRQKNIFRRAARILDNYLNIAGHHCYDYSEVKDENGLNNIRSSRYLRPYSSRFAFLEPLCLHRIKKQIRYAAKHNKIFHMWWHPYNMGIHTSENLKRLKDLLCFYKKMEIKYYMRSFNMGELGDVFSD